MENEILYQENLFQEYNFEEMLYNFNKTVIFTYQNVTMQAKYLNHQHVTVTACCVVCFGWDLSLINKTL